MLHYSGGADCVGDCLGICAVWVFAGGQGVLYAIKPVVVAIIIQALGKLSRTGVRTPLLAVIAALAAVLSLWESARCWCWWLRACYRLRRWG